MKTQKITHHQYQQIVNDSICLTCKDQRNKAESLMRRGGGHLDEEGVWRPHGWLIVCTYNSSHHHFQVSPGDAKNPPRVTAGVKLPPEGPTVATRADVMPSRRHKS